MPKKVVAQQVIQPKLIMLARRVSPYLAKFLQTYVSMVDFVREVTSGKFEGDPATRFSELVDNVHGFRPKVRKYVDNSYFIELKRFANRLLKSRILEQDLSKLKGSAVFRFNMMRVMNTFSTMVKTLLANTVIPKDRQYAERIRRFKGIPVGFYRMKTKKEVQLEQKEQKIAEEIGAIEEIKANNERNNETKAIDNDQVLDRARIMGKLVQVGMNPEDSDLMNEALSEFTVDRNALLKEKQVIGKQVKRLRRRRGDVARSDIPDKEAALEAIDNDIFAQKEALSGKFTGGWTDNAGGAGTWDMVREFGRVPGLTAQIVNPALKNLIGGWSVKGLDPENPNRIIRLLVNQKGIVRGRDIPIAGRFYLKGRGIEGWIRLEAKRKVTFDEGFMGERGVDQKLTIIKDRMNDVRDGFDRYIYTPEGEVVPMHNWMKDTVEERREQQGLENVHKIDKYVKKYQDQILSEDVVDDKIEEGAEIRWLALTDEEIPTNVALTKMFPVVEIGERAVVADGEFKGVPLDILVNQANRLIKGSSYVVQEGGGVQKMEMKRETGEMEYLVQTEPYVTVSGKGDLMIVLPRKATKNIKASPVFKVIKDIAQYSQTVRSLLKPGEEEYSVRTILPVSTFIISPQDLDDIKDRIGSLSMSHRAAAIMRKYYDKRREMKEALIEEQYGNILPETVEGFKKTFVDADGTEKPFEFRSFQKKAISFLVTKGNGLCGLDTGLGKCQKYDTELRYRDDGSVIVRKIGELFDDIYKSDKFRVIDKDNKSEYIEPFDEYSILSYDCEGSEFSENRIVGLYRQRVSENLYSIKTHNGLTLDVTGAHKLALVRDGSVKFVKASEAAVGDRIVLRCGATLFAETDPVWLTPQFARFMAYAISEGHFRLGTDYYGKITQKEKAVLVSIKHDVENSYLSELVTSSKIRRKKGKDTHFLAVYGRQLRDWHLEKFGYDIDGVSRNKVIPRYILSGSKEIQRIFLRAYFEAEGTVNRSGDIAVTSASAELIAQLQLMLVNFGVMTRIRPKQKSATNGKNIKRKYYDLIVSSSGFGTFREEIGFESDAKNDKLDILCSKVRNPNVDTYPVTSILKEFARLVDGLPLRTYFGIQCEYLQEKEPTNVRLGFIIDKIRELRDGILLDTLLKELSIKKSKYSPRDVYIKRQLSVISQLDMGQVDGIIERLEFFFDGGVYCDRIVDVRVEQYDGYVYDLTVEDNHNYVLANGLLVHNSVVSVATLLSFIKDGTLQKGGKNGKALYVVPASLRGNIPAEIRKFCENPDEVLEYIDIMSYDDFRRRDNTEIEQYGAVFFDEAQALKNAIGKGASKVAKKALRLNHPRKVLLTASVMEKALTLDSGILTPTGWITMGEAKVGQDVITPDGSVAKITAVHPQGVRDVYEVVFNDGVSVRCGEGHLWATCTYRERNEKERVWNPETKAYKSPPVLERIAKRQYVPRRTSEISETLVQCCGDSEHLNHQIPMVKNIEFESAELPISPYLLGVLIGDGHIANGEVSFTCNEEDRFIADKVENLLPDGHGYNLQNRNGNLRCRITKGTANSVPTEIRQELENLGLYGCLSDTKFVPRAYLFATASDRLELLKGLMDTDGAINKGGETTPLFCTVSEQLGQDVKHLVESLGGTVTITTRTPYYMANGSKRQGKKAYHVYIRLMENVFSLPRKADRWVMHKSKLPLRYVKEVNFVGKEEIQCITVDHPSGLFITDHFVVTHNSPEDLYNLVMIADNTYNVDEEKATRHRNEFLRETCEIIAGRAVAIKQSPSAIDRMRDWVKANALYVDKREVAEEINLPPVTPPAEQNVAIQMIPEQMRLYAAPAQSISETLEKMEDKYLDKRLTIAEVKNEVTKSNIMDNIIRLREISNDPELYVKKHEARRIAREKYGKEMGELTAEEKRSVIEEVNKTVPAMDNPKLERCKESVAAKIAKGRRVAVWTDQPSFALKTGLELALEFPGKYVAVCLADRMSIYTSDGKIASYDGAAVGRVCNPVEVEGRSACVGEASFRPSSKYVYPNGESVPKRQWQKYIMDYVLASDSNISVVVLTSAYATGHNLQWCSSVIHMDRDSWNNEMMKQRTARCWRQGQEQSVEVEILDATVPGDGSEEFVAINEIQRWMMEMEEELFDKVVRKSIAAELNSKLVEFGIAQEVIGRRSKTIDKRALVYIQDPSTAAEANLVGQDVGEEQ
jgi:intein/homing endonuclease